MPARQAPTFMPAMIPLPSMLSGPISALGPYSTDGSLRRGSIIMRIATLPCMPPVAMMTMAHPCRSISNKRTVGIQVS